MQRVLVLENVLLYDNQKRDEKQWGLMSMKMYVNKNHFLDCWKFIIGKHEGVNVGC